MTNGKRGDSTFRVVTVRGETDFSELGAASGEFKASPSGLANVCLEDGDNGVLGSPGGESFAFNGPGTAIHTD